MSESMTMAASADQRSEVERYLRRHAGMPELCDALATTWMWRLGILLLSLSATVPAFLLVAGIGMDRWEQWGLVALAASIFFAAISVTFYDAWRPQRSRRLAERLAHYTVFGVAGLLVLAAAGFVAYQGAVQDDAQPGQPVKAYNLALALLAVTLYVIAACDGVALVRAVLAETMQLRWRHVRSAIRPMPEMVVLVAFVVILGDVWKVLAHMNGWRVEVFLLTCVGLTASAIAVHLAEHLRGIWCVDPQSALWAARRNVRTAHLVTHAVIDDRRPLGLSGRARLNAVLLVVLPVTVRLLVAAAILTAFLFLVGMLLMDSTYLGDVVPGVPAPIAAAKVAGMLSGLAAVAFAVANKGRVLEGMSARRIVDVRATLGVWAAYGRREGAGAAETVVPSSVPAPAS